MQEMIANERKDILVSWIEKEKEEAYFSKRSAQPGWSYPHRIFSNAHFSSTNLKMFLNSFGNVFASLEDHEKGEIHFIENYPFQKHTLSTKQLPINYFNYEAPIFIDEEIQFIGSGNKERFFGPHPVMVSPKGEITDVATLVEPKTYFSGDIGVFQKGENVLLITKKEEETKKAFKECLVYSWYLEGKWTQFKPIKQYIYRKNRKIYLEDFTGSVNANNSAVLCWKYCRKFGNEHLYKVQAAVVNGTEVLRTVDLSSFNKNEVDTLVEIDDLGNILALMEDDKGKVTFAYKLVDKGWIFPKNGFPAITKSSDHREEKHILHEFLNQDLTSRKFYDSFVLKPDHRGNFILVWSGLYRKNFQIFGAIFSSETQKWSDPIILTPINLDYLTDDVHITTHIQPKLVITGDGEGAISWIKVVAKVDQKSSIKALQSIDSITYALEVSEFVY